LQPHGIAKRNEPFIRTQPSTLKALKKASMTHRPGVCVDLVQEEQGGMLGCASSGSLPRNIVQAYNNTRSSELDGFTEFDPFSSVILMCKEQAKDEKTAFVRFVGSAPEPVVVCTTNDQMEDVKKFCTNENHFCVFQADPMCDLGNFYVTTTQYEHLLLLTRRGNTHPAILGPILIHQRKEESTYKVLTNFMCSQEHMLKNNIKAFGTDGEQGLIKAFSSTFSRAMQLHCFIHFEGNIKEHLKSIAGADPTAVKSGE